MGLSVVVVLVTWLVVASVGGRNYCFETSKSVFGALVYDSSDSGFVGPIFNGSFPTLTSRKWVIDSLLEKKPVSLAYGLTRSMCEPVDISIRAWEHCTHEWNVTGAGFHRTLNIYVAKGCFKHTLDLSFAMAFPRDFFVDSFELASHDKRFKWHVVAGQPPIDLEAPAHSNASQPFIIGATYRNVEPLNETFIISVPFHVRYPEPSTNDVTGEAKVSLPYVPSVWVHDHYVWVEAVTHNRTVVLMMVPRLRQEDQLFYYLVAGITTIVGVLLFLWKWRPNVSRNEEKKKKD